MMKMITKIDVQPMYDEIDNNLWLSTGKIEDQERGKAFHARNGHGRNWIGSEIQTLIRHEIRFPTQTVELTEYDPCDFETPLDDLCLPNFRPTNAMFMYPEAMKTLVWFATTFGGKYARAMYYRTPPDTSVDIHIDAQPDRFGVIDKRHLQMAMDDGRARPGEDNKVHFYYKKDRYHVVIDGSFEYTVDYELEDKIYEFPLTMTSPVTKTFSKGEVWWFNNKRPHKSYNNGNIPKINLVFDIEGTTCLTNPSMNQNF